MAFGATHAPVQVPKRYIDKYVSIYEKGWDALREERYRAARARHISSGHEAAAAKSR